MMDVCPICSKEYKNLGSHMAHAHKEQKADGGNIVVDDYVPEKLLSDLISELRAVLKKVHHCQLTVETMEQNGITGEVVITARIQTRR
jgi:hypothetical protein